MTPKLCTDFCSGAGFSQAGVEWGRECYCSSTVNLATVTPSGQCNVPCSGDSTAICGGPQALIIYTTTAKPNDVVTLSNGWQSKHVCLTDGVNGRLLNGASMTSDTLTPLSCTNFCKEKGFTGAGMEYANQCYCGTVPSNATTSSNCNMACSGDQTALCGGGNALTIYTAGASTKKRALRPVKKRSSPKH